MRVAFAAWNGRIAPLFDVTRRLHVIDTAGRQVVGAFETSLVDDPSAARATRLSALGIDALVCGAISRPQEALIQAYGVRVVAFVTGELGAVIAAWSAGRLGEAAFAMPGCGGRGHRFRGGRGRRRLTQCRGQRR